jgi:hypothetical protein
MRKGSLIADQRGAVAFEMPIITIVLLFSLLLPLADVAIAGFQFISAWEALRAFGQSIQYSPPIDVANSSTWVSTAIANAASADPKHPISNFQLICGDSNVVCSSANTASPKYYSYTTSIRLAPMVLKSVLCKSGNCTFTIPYSEQFQ